MRSAVNSGLPEMVERGFYELNKKGMWILHSTLVFGMKLNTDEPGVVSIFNDLNQ